MVQINRPTVLKPLQRDALKYLVELSFAIADQTLEGSIWPDVVYIRPPVGVDEERILECWSENVAKERGTPVDIMFVAAITN